jgi:hypothetical protein
MSYRPHGRARVNADSPAAFGRCDRCGFIYNHAALRFQFDYRGPQLANLRFLVCAPCYDKPQPQLKPIILTEDPLPIVNARPEDYNYANNANLFAPLGTTTSASTGLPIYAGTDLTTEDGVNIDTQPTGRPNGMNPNAVPPQYLTKHYNVVIPVTSIIANGTNTVTVTCSAAHNLSTNDQVSVEGITNSNAAGIYSVTVTTGTVFTYNTYSVVNSGSLLTSTTRIATAIVGIPPQNTQIPLTGAYNE